ncbi:MAG TPA: hypothetical protein VGP83_17195 [Pyrinomonadaceae bacterium]|jgi:hypothetical protein|nr:hypothetical protein [Pyrinomonadaceae bacterium]
MSREDDDDFVLVRERSKDEERFAYMRQMLERFIEEQHGNSDPEVQALVARSRQKLMDGTFAVPAQVLAEGLLKSEKFMRDLSADGALEETIFDAAAQYPHKRILPDDGLVAVYRTITGNGRLLYCKSRYDYGPTGSWCYPSLRDALEAMEEWENPAPDTRPPDGWFRELHTGWRRKDGDPEQEYFQP